jgi:ABC-2 type transport system ATP-binding protein
MAVVEIQGLTKRYGPVEALRGIDLSVEEGEIFGLLGPNGAGKTTTVEIISGLIPRDGGTVKVLGRDPEQERHRLTHFIALQPQHMDFLDNATVGEIVALFRSLYAGVDRQRVRRILERLGLHDRQRTRFQHLSGGQRQRLNLALALIGNPRLVILDEPTAGLDPQARVQIHDFIREIRAEGRTVILTTHYLEEAEALCDRVAIIDHGKIIACDAPRRLIMSFGGQTRIEWTDSSGAITPEGLPGVIRAVREEDRWVCWTGDPATTLAALFDHSRAQSTQVRELSVHPPTLEDIFIQITGKHFRD